jgi:hypothetical protein
VPGITTASRFGTRTEEISANSSPNNTPTKPKLTPKIGQSPCNPPHEPFNDHRPPPPKASPAACAPIFSKDTNVSLIEIMCLPEPMFLHIIFSSLQSQAAGIQRFDWMSGIAVETRAIKMGPGALRLAFFRAGAKLRGLSHCNSSACFPSHPHCWGFLIPRGDRKQFACGERN